MDRAQVTACPECQGRGTLVAGPALWRSLVPFSLVGLGICTVLGALWLQVGILVLLAALVAAVCGLAVVVLLIEKGAVYHLRSGVALLLWIVAGGAPRCPGCWGRGTHASPAYVDVLDQLLLIAFMVLGFLVLAVSVFLLP